MHNFEDRYRAIVEKKPELEHPSIYFDERSQYEINNPEPIIYDNACAIACWWLAGKLPGEYRFVIGPSESYVEQWFGYPLFKWRTLCASTDPADAILTAWEIILGIKKSHERIPQIT